MNNKEYAEKMTEEAEKWMELLPVTKELWLQIADRIEASPDPLAVQQEKRKQDKVALCTAPLEESWFKRLFFRRSAEKETKALPDFEWKLL